jgi:hypothetical protein
MTQNIDAFRERSADFRTEIPAFYYSLAQDNTLKGDGETDPCEWWLGRKAKFPAMFALLRVLLLCQPNSATVERIFSLINAYMTSQQCAFNDQTMLAQVQTQFNERQQAQAKQRGSDPNKPNNYRNVWTSVREFIASQQKLARWCNEPRLGEVTQPAARPIVELLARTAGSQVHQAPIYEP